MSIKQKIYKYYSRFLSLDVIWMMWVLFNKYFNSNFIFYLKNPLDIPIVINNYNKLSTLKLMVQKLRILGYKNLIVIDNASSYQPLKDYYSSTNEFKLITSQNLGHRSLFLSSNSELKKIRKGCFIYTDSDLILNENLQPNFVEELFKTLLKYNKVAKVGFALKISDLNSLSSTNKELIKWESNFWTKEIEANKFKASIDTTFALYRPPLYIGTNTMVRFYKGIRIAGNFTCQHDPWYWDFQNLDEEQRFYFDHANKSSSYMNLIKENDIENFRT